MKKEDKDQKKSPSSGLGAFLLLTLSFTLVSAALFLFLPDETSDRLPAENFNFDSSPIEVKKKIVSSNDFINLENSVKQRPVLQDQKLPQAYEHKSFTSSHNKSTTSSVGLTGEALKKHLDSELRNAQDLVDSEDPENILKAKTMLESILEKDPKHNETLKELAMIYMYDLDNNVKAEEYMLKSYDIKPDGPVFTEVMQLARQNGTLGSFAETVSQRAQKNPDDSNYASQAATIMGDQGNNEESAQMHARNGERFGSSREFQNAASRYEIIGNKAEARNMYKKALEQAILDPDVSESEKNYLQSRIKSLKLN